jgi:ribose-phosphate pyrophosphokinase
LKQRSNPLSWITVDDAELSVDKFPDGSFRFTVDYQGVYSSVVGPRFNVTLKSTLPEALHACFQVCSALLDNFNTCYIALTVQTFPDQRADRSEKPGMAIPAIATCTFLAAMPVDEIVIFDIHNKSVLEAFKIGCNYSGIKVRHVEPLDCFIQALSMPDLDPATSIDYVVAVDKGAVHRAETVAKYYGASVIYCDKKRVDGKVVVHEIVAQPDGPMAGKNIWVVDDLCDGGATFISVAKLLREQYDFHDLNLYVTHGLFSKGKEELFKYYTTILALFDYGA